MEIIEATVVMIDFVDVLSDVALDAWTDALVSVIIGFVPDIGAEVLADAIASDFISLVTPLEFGITEPLKGFGC